MPAIAKAFIPDLLSRSEAALRKGLRKGAASYLDDFLRRYEHGGLMSASYGATARAGLREGMEQGWLVAWMVTGRELTALVRRRFPVRGVRSLAAQPEIEQPPRLSLPPPLPLPTDFRTWLETHTVAEGGTAAVPIPRSGAEWLAEHEAQVSKWVPREYVDRYVQTRLPPLAGIADRHLLETARDIVAASEERGFGVRETMRSLRRDFPAFAAQRLENIARTEGAVLFEHGRLSRFRADGLVQGVRFDAVVDDRTTEICLWHEGREWPMDDPDMLVPPSHYQCRSVLQPILFNEKPNWNTETAPEKAQPLEGFGRPDATLLPPNRTPEELFGSSGIAMQPAQSAVKPTWIQAQLAAGKESSMASYERPPTDAELARVAQLWEKHVPTEIKTFAQAWEEENGFGLPIQVSIIEDRAAVASASSRAIALNAEDIFEVGGHHITNHELRHALCDTATVEAAGEGRGVYGAMHAAGVRTPVHVNRMARGRRYGGANEWVNDVADSYNKSGMTIDEQVAEAVSGPGVACERVLGSGQVDYMDSGRWTEDEARAAISLWRKWVGIP